MKIYINGVEDKSVAKTGNIETSTINLHIGDRTNEASGRRYNGSADEIKIYNRALTSQEILALYNEAGECVDTTALLDFISSWKQGILGMASLLQKIATWKAGTGC